VTASPTVSVLSVSWNTAACLPGALDALGAACADHPYEVIVVDNASSDDSANVLAARSDVDLVSLDRNTGFTYAANRAAARAKGRLLLFLNPDLLAPPHAIDRLVDALDGDPGAWAATPWFRNPDGTPQHFWRRMPGPLRLPLCYTRVGKKLDESLGWPTRRWQRYADLPDPPPRQHIDAVGAACLLVRRDLFERAGGFDERYFNFFQDADLERRMRSDGWKLLGVGDVEVVHQLGVTFRSLPPWEVDAQLLHALRQYLAGEPLRRRLAGELVVRADLRLRPRTDRAALRARALLPVDQPC